MITLKRITPKGSEDKFLNKKLALIRQTIINNCIYVGELALEIARTQHKYKRQTGNLTSSVGYCIIDNGNVVKMSDFEVVGEGAEGARRGREYLEGLIRENSKGIVFIMVAGMPYAKYVEAMSLDVLESAELYSKRTLPKLIKALNL